MTDMPPSGLFFIHVMKTAGSALGRQWRRDLDSTATYPDIRNGERADKKVLAENLVSVDAARWGRLRLVSVHMPAWTTELAPDFLRATLLRDPVERTVSHLRHVARMPNTPDDIEVIWDDDGWRHRLTDYQTRIFSETRERFDARRALAMAVRGSAHELTDADRATMAAELQRNFTTGIESTDGVADADLARAIDRLATFDIVGTTDTVDQFAAAVARRMSWPSVGAVERWNTNDDTRSPSPRLLRSIEDACRLDVELYAFARRRVDELGPPNTSD